MHMDGPMRAAAAWVEPCQHPIPRRDPPRDGSALEVGLEAMVTYDRRMAEAARMAGMRVASPGDDGGVSAPNRRGWPAPPAHPSGARPPAIPAELVPRHVALVMDGNGRWANQRGLPRTKGHEAGEAALLDVIHGAIELGVGTLSAYAFSTENWRRSPDEVRFLMGFNRAVIRRRRDELQRAGGPDPVGRPAAAAVAVGDLRAGGRRADDRRQRRHHAAVLRELRRPGGDRRRGPGDRPRGRRRPGGPGEGRRADDRPAPRRARPAGRRPVHPVVGGAAHVELPALAVGVRGAGLPRHALPRLRPA